MNKYQEAVKEVYKRYGEVYYRFCVFSRSVDTLDPEVDEKDVKEVLLGCSTRKRNIIKRLASIIPVVEDRLTIKLSDYTEAMAMYELLDKALQQHEVKLF